MSQTIGTISIDLGTNMASFLSGMDKATATVKSSVKSLGSTISGFGDLLGEALEPLGGQLGGQLSGLFSDIGSSVSAVSSKMGGMSGAMGIATTAAAGLAGVGIAVAASLTEMALSGGEMAESLSHMSQKTGISVRDLQTLQAAGDVAGVGLDEIVIAMRKFSEALTGTGKGGNALAGTLKRLGVTSHDSNEALLQVADAFSKMQDGPVKASLAVELFGKSGMSLIPMLNEGRDGIAEFSAMVDKFGPNIDQNAVRGMENWKKSTEELSLAWDKFKSSLSGGVSILAKVVDAIAKAAAGMSDMAKTVIQHPFLSSFAASTGGIGLLAIHQFSEAGKSTAAGADNSAAQRAQLAAQDALIASKQRLFEIEKSGGAAAYALAQQQQAIAAAVAATDFDTALALQAQLPALQKAADLEKQRLAAAKAALAAHEKFLELVAKQGRGEIHATNLFRREPVVQAPDVRTTAAQFDEIRESLEKLTNAGGVTSAVLQIGADNLDEFYSHWRGKSDETVDSINKKYDEELSHFNGLLALQAISLKQYQGVEAAINQQRAKDLQDLAVKSGKDYGASFKDVFSQIADEGDKMAAHLADSLGNAFRDLTSQLAQFATTGKANFKQIGQSLEQSVIKGGLDKLASGGIKAIAGHFGLNTGGKPDGTASNPIHVKNVDGLSGALHGQKLGNISSELSGAFKSIGSGLGSFFGKIGGGIGSIFGSIFGGFRAGGGDVTPGKAFIVGEQRPEVFVPRSAGTIVPSVSSGPRRVHQLPDVHVHYHGIADYDSLHRHNNDIQSRIASTIQQTVYKMSRG